MNEKQIVQAGWDVFVSVVFYLTTRRFNILWGQPRSQAGSCRGTRFASPWNLHLYTPAGMPAHLNRVISGWWIGSKERESHCNYINVFFLLIQTKRSLWSEIPDSANNLLPTLKALWHSNCPVFHLLPPSRSTSEMFLVLCLRWNLSGSRTGSYTLTTSSRKQLRMLDSIGAGCVPCRTEDLCTLDLSEYVKPHICALFCSKDMTVMHPPWVVLRRAWDLQLRHAKHFSWAHNVYDRRQFWTITALALGLCAKTVTHSLWLQTLGVPVQLEITVAFSAVFSELSQLCARDK